MNTKTLLIIFAVLLLLLTLLSAFGGSLKPSENFENGHPFEKFFDPSLMVQPEGQAVSNNPLFQEQSSLELGKESFTNNVIDEQQQQVPALVAESNGAFVEPFENLDTPTFGPY